MEELPHKAALLLKWDVLGLAVVTTGYLVNAITSGGVDASRKVTFPPTLAVNFTISSWKFAKRRRLIWRFCN